MKTTIYDSGIILNEKPMKGSVNPHECHTYEHQILYTEHFTSDDEFQPSTEEWFLSGDIPLHLEIDNNGLITGRVAIFNDQPSCKDNHPDEDIVLSGENWKNTGRYKHDQYIFKFTVHRKYIYTDLLTMEDIEEEVTSDVEILVIKNRNIDNLIFVKRYLESGHELKIDNDSYFEENINDFISRHPGPFILCDKQ